jgi:hypothetical protein
MREFLAAAIWPTPLLKRYAGRCFDGLSRRGRHCPPKKHAGASGMRKRNRSENQAPSGQRDPEHVPRLEI